jgi:HD-GYP domain-containing protein (c-di-GMP phosphodiesterase class II)
MYRQLSVNLGNLLLSLSDAMDLADSSIALHQQRTAFIACEMGKAADLSPAAVKRLFVAALLHDIGALSLEEKIGIHRFDIVNTDLHCIRGESLMESIPWLRPASKIVRYHHREWEQWNEPIDAPMVLESQILFLADYLERIIMRDVYILHQDELLCRKITDLAGAAIHPDVVDIFRSFCFREEFWLDVVSPRLYSLLLHNGPYRQVEADLISVGTIGELFRNTIDFRSRFTSTHSSGVAECAALLAQRAGFSDAEVHLMRVAGNFHDIGKLAVPNSILNKPGKLTKEEFAVMRQHTYYTFSVINSIGGLEHIAEWAAFHHERLDGAGYPFHHKADHLSTGSRIMAVADIFTALTEDRPYREGMQEAAAEKILRQLAAGNAIDSRILDLLLDNSRDILVKVKERQNSTKQDYERQFGLAEAKPAPADR